MSFYGWRHEGQTKDGRHYAYFWNDGNIMASEFFNTLQECLDFVKRWFTTTAS